MHDVIVVGAGPAGSVLAYLLARRGLDVLIVEKAILPRYKACGGGLTWKAIWNLPFDVSQVLDLKAVGGKLTYAGKPLLKAAVAKPIAYLVMRDRFDHYLVQQAVQAGARLVESTGVTGIVEHGDQIGVITSGGEFQARILAGANSIVRRSVGLLPNREVGVALEAEVQVAPAALAAQAAYATFDFGALPHGYGWIFPKRDHLSVGVFRAAPGKANGLKLELDRFIASQTVLVDPRILHLEGHLVPLGGRRQALHRGRVLLVGDAANLADPWLGEGISYAIASARLAAEHIFSSLVSKNIDLSGYSRTVNSSITAQFRYARLFARIVYSLPGFSSKLLSRSPFLQQAMFEVLCGDRSFKEMTAALCLGLPRILSEGLFKPGGHGPYSQ